MTVFEVFQLPKKRGKQVFQVTTNQRIFFTLFSHKESVTEEKLTPYLQKSETIVSIKKAIDVIIPQETKKEES